MLPILLRPILARPLTARIFATTCAVAIGTLMLGGTIAMCRTLSPSDVVPHMCGSSLSFPAR